MRKGRKGKTARGVASKASNTNTKPVGTDKKGIHPLTSKTGNKKMNRNLRGADKRGNGPSVVVNEKHNKLAGRYF